LVISFHIVKDYPTLKHVDNSYINVEGEDAISYGYKLFQTKASDLISHLDNTISVFIEIFALYKERSYRYMAAVLKLYHIMG
jgi:hypothetical protein